MVENYSIADRVRTKAMGFYSGGEIGVLQMIFYPW
jgi:hypothetical protein